MTQLGKEEASGGARIPSECSPVPECCWCPVCPVPECPVPECQSTRVLVAGTNRSAAAANIHCTSPLQCWFTKQQTMFILPALQCLQCTAYKATLHAKHWKFTENFSTTTLQL